MHKLKTSWLSSPGLLLLTGTFLMVEASESDSALEAEAAESAARDFSWSFSRSSTREM